ncbi:unnamed protein product [Amoebophrya sp. A120]|nr:unnamed protein product [Amoebophrya sp. A120]|eukprot:GSA120T00018249001.1
MGALSSGRDDENDVAPEDKEAASSQLEVNKSLLRGPCPPGRPCLNVRPGRPCQELNKSLLFQPPGDLDVMGEDKMKIWQQKEQVPEEQSQTLWGGLWNRLVSKLRPKREATETESIAYRRLTVEEAKSLVDKVFTTSNEVKGGVAAFIGRHWKKNLSEVDTSGIRKWGTSGAVFWEQLERNWLLADLQRMPLSPQPIEQDQIAKLNEDFSTNPADRDMGDLHFPNFPINLQPSSEQKLMQLFDKIDEGTKYSAEDKAEFKLIYGMIFANIKEKGRVLSLSLVEPEKQRFLSDRSDSSTNTCALVLNVGRILDSDGPHLLLSGPQFGISVLTAPPEEKPPSTLIQKAPTQQLEVEPLPLPTPSSALEIPETGTASFSTGSTSSNNLESYENINEQQFHFNNKYTNDHIFSPNTNATGHHVQHRAADCILPGLSCLGFASLLILFYYYWRSSGGSSCGCAKRCPKYCCSCIKPVAVVKTKMRSEETALLLQDVLEGGGTDHADAGRSMTFGEEADFDAEHERITSSVFGCSHYGGGNYTSGSVLP